MSDAPRRKLVRQAACQFDFSFFLIYLFFIFTSREGNMQLYSIVAVISVL